MNRDIADVRRTYSGDGLNLDNTPAEPFEQFQEWLTSALSADDNDANVMTLSTVDSQGKPHARIVLLKGYDAQGFIFYTNYQSHKGSELANMPHAALTFWWPAMERQVRIEGRVEKVSDATSDHYFASRPKESQLGAWVSQQSVEIPDRDWLSERQGRFEKVYADSDVPRPEHWGGYRVVPEMIEFWQGQPSRLHDRVRYQRLDTEDNEWHKVMLAP
ncbi:MULTISPECIES: pyridoxamine 5'-phosphate oxidase [Cobetia]|uniref:pyridoxamine 5'-phosphate oxidase n=1 Tax=Cobetia TaxID=204286 RepID=UPI000864B9E9|nr:MULTISPECIES: pyridoxamine 5'-phosphate oxidase [Cobetia]AOM01465.1 pyridoxamine 5'-phosphate oxidase [Cobetia marina]AZV31379.1 pyridoxamine 5'-phosphate oxidase [Cobetia sp. ICG0124]